MSLFGSLKTGVAGLTAQSSSMSIISDNIANVSTTGYKANSAAFSTLVTKQTSSTMYSSGGVFCRTREGIDVQGLLSTSVNDTDLAISGNGFFVTTTAAEADNNTLYSYTRAGSFGVDNDGYLVNENGQYLQAWTLQAFDGNDQASIVNVNGQNFMKSYTDTKGKTVYINDNIIDYENLQSVNLNKIGGTAQETTEIQFGANLPADDPIFDPANPEAGGRYTSAILMYDSLGNSHNVQVTFTKVGTGAWSVDMGLPSGVSDLVTYSNKEATNDAAQDVYAAAAQLEFDAIPVNHSTIGIEIAGKNYVFEFSTDGTKAYSPTSKEQVYLVDISAGIVTIEDAVKNLYKEMELVLPGANRFTLGTNGRSVQIQQSTAGAAVKFNCSNCFACMQSQSNPDPTTGIATGIFEMPEIDWDVKNAARLEFTSNKMVDYIGKAITIGKNTYKFSDAESGDDGEGVITVNIKSAIDYVNKTVDTVKVVSLLKNKINNVEPDYSRYFASGSTLEIEPSATGDNILVNTGNSVALTFQHTTLAAYVGATVSLGSGMGNLRTYKFYDKNTDGKTGSLDNDGNIVVNLSDLKDLNYSNALPTAVMNSLNNAIKTFYKNHEDLEDISNYFEISGSTMVSTNNYLISQEATVEETTQKLTFSSSNAKDYEGEEVTIMGDKFKFTVFGATKTGTGTEASTISLLESGAVASETVDFQYTATGASNPNSSVYNPDLVGATVTLKGIDFNFSRYGDQTQTNVGLVNKQTISVPSGSIDADSHINIQGIKYQFKALSAMNSKNIPEITPSGTLIQDVLTTYTIPTADGSGTITFNFADGSGESKTSGTVEETATNTYTIYYNYSGASDDASKDAETRKVLTGLANKIAGTSGLGTPSVGATALTFTYTPPTWVSLDSGSPNLALKNLQDKVGGTLSGSTLTLNGTGLREITEKDDSDIIITEYMDAGLEYVAAATGGTYANGKISYTDSNCIDISTNTTIPFTDENWYSVTTTSSSVMEALARLAGKEDYVAGNIMTLKSVEGKPFEGTNSKPATIDTDGGTVNLADVITAKTANGLNSAVKVFGRDNGSQAGQPDTDGTLVLTNKFSFNNIADSETGSIIAGVAFNADGTPSSVNVNNLAFEWCNGASDMSGSGNYYESSQINFFLGNENTAQGLTQFAGQYATNYITQNGAKFGNYTGVSVSEDGVVTAIFDNGETRPIAQIPLATFVDPNSLEALTGNIWIETTGSGVATLRTAGEGGSGTIASNSLEDSTVDIANEFTNMITTQRAYSAASKIITTADSMLEELVNIIR
ncbi:MAG: flagellar hook-basal body complex protein [Alphaproteobacteria bacterium]|nr:flagellar hook-basal body complex protein [Alphaproteobacteria bacterium]